MTTESLFLEKWKELESATHLSFPTWDGRDMEKFLKKMRDEQKFDSLDVLSAQIVSDCESARAWFDMK